MESEAKSIPGLYEPHDGRAFKLDKEEWTDDYLNELRVQVISNFSHERLQHLQDVIRHLRPVPEPARQLSSGSEPRRNVTYAEQKRRDQENGSYIGPKVATGAVIGAAAGVAIVAVASVATAGVADAAAASAASITAAKVAGAAAAGGAIGGAVTYVISNKEH